MQPGVETKYAGSQSIWSGAGEISVIFFWASSLLGLCEQYSGFIEGLLCMLFVCKVLDPGYSSAFTRTRLGP